MNANACGASLPGTASNAARAAMLRRPQIDLAAVASVAVQSANDSAHPLEGTLPPTRGTSERERATDATRARLPVDASDVSQPSS